MVIIPVIMVLIMVIIMVIIMIIIVIIMENSYHAEQLLFSCQFSKVSSCQVVRLCAYHVYSTASNLAIRSQTMLTGIILYYLVTQLKRVLFNV